MTETILITGANRGLGLEFVRQYSKENTLLLACCRFPNEATELQDLQKQHKNIQLHSLDVTSTTSIEALAKKITQPIDILINNAGMLENDSFEDLSVDVLTKTFQTNSIAPMKVTEAFIRHLEKGKRKLVASVTSSMGSITENTTGGYYSYRASKAALNMMMKSAAIDLAPIGIKVLLLHPGWVKTRMGGNNAALTPEESISGMRKVIASYSPKSGEVVFYQYNGEKMPW